MAVPNEPKTCRATLVSDEARLIRCSGAAFMAAVMAGIITRPMAAPRSMSMPRSSLSGVVRSRLDSSQVVSATRGRPIRSSRAQPDAVDDAPDERHHDQHRQRLEHRDQAGLGRAQTAEVLQEERHQQLTAEHADGEHEVDQHRQREDAVLEQAQLEQRLLVGQLNPHPEHERDRADDEASNDARARPAVGIRVG